MTPTIRRIGAAALTLALGLSAAGCWGAPGQGPDRRSHNAFEGRITATTAPTLTRAWEATGVPDEGGVSSQMGDPVVSTRGVHANDRLRAYGFDRATGERRWSYREVDSDISYAGQVVTEGDRVLASFGMGGRGSAHRWIDGRTGAPLPPGPEASHGVTSGLNERFIVSHQSYYGSGNPGPTYLHVFDRHEPANSWSGLTAVGTYSSGPPPTLGATRVFHAGVGIVSTEEEPPEGANGVRAYPLTGGTSDCGPLGVYACPVWISLFPTAADAVTSPVLAPGDTALYVGTGDGRVRALDPATGAALWSADVGGVPADEPALADGVLYVPLQDGRLVALPADGCPSTGCAPAWSATLGGVGGQPAVAGTGEDAVVVVGTAAGTVEAFPAAGCGSATCAPVWEDDVGSPITGDPAITGGRVYVGTQDGRLVAYAPATAPPAA